MWQRKRGGTRHMGRSREKESQVIKTFATKVSKNKEEEMSRVEKPSVSRPQRKGFQWKWCLPFQKNDRQWICMDQGQPGKEKALWPCWPLRPGWCLYPDRKREQDKIHLPAIHWIQFQFNLNYVALFTTDNSLPKQKSFLMRTAEWHSGGKNSLRAWGGNMKRNSDLKG